MLEKSDSFLVAEENCSLRVLETARKFRPDVIFLDLSLPKKDGHTIAAELQNDPQLRSVPIVFWSGSFRRKKMAVSQSPSDRSELPKPFSHADLEQFATSFC
jgi:CheY-like chemotaxis protein